MSGGRTCGLTASDGTTMWEPSQMKSRFSPFFEKKWRLSRALVDAFKNRVDYSRTRDDVTDSEQAKMESLFQKYESRLTKLWRSMTIQKVTKKAGVLPGMSKLIISRASSEHEGDDVRVGWFHIRGESPRNACDSRDDWLAFCSLFTYFEKTLKKDARNFDNRKCNRKSRFSTSCASPCQKTSLNGCAYNEAEILPRVDIAN